MRWFCVLPFLTLGSPVFAQDSGQGQTIVITALSQTARALRDCLARHCSPEEDIAASLAHAENQFVAGDYEGARRTIKASIGRNGRFASRLPVPVSYLYRASSRVAVHLGEGHDFEQSTWGIKRALKAGLPRDDVRLVAADLEVAGMQASLGRADVARRMYGEAMSDASRIGRPDLAAMARVRLAWLTNLEGDRPLARRWLQEVAADRSPPARAARLSALVLLARIDREQGRHGSSDALVAELRSAGLSKPALLYAPPMEREGREIDLSLKDNYRLLRNGKPSAYSTTRLMAAENFDDRWVDIGFWVTPEGRVKDADILRHSGPTYWAQPLVRSISGRVYLPGGDVGSDGTYRIERYSYTSLWMDRTGTHLRQRGPNARLEFLDLTAEPKARSN